MKKPSSLSVAVVWRRRRLASRGLPIKLHVVMLHSVPSRIYKWDARENWPSVVFVVTCVQCGQLSTPGPARHRHTHRAYNRLQRRCTCESTTTNRSADNRRMVTVRLGLWRLLCVLLAVFTLTVAYRYEQYEEKRDLERMMPFVPRFAKNLNRSDLNGPSITARNDKNFFIGSRYGKRGMFAEDKEPSTKICFYTGVGELYKCTDSKEYAGQRLREYNSEEYN